MIYEIILSQWEDILGLTDSLHGFVFRGQRDYHWPLSTTLERYIDEGLDAPNREAWILNQFRRRAHNIIDKAPDENELIEWMALLQHYGGPTRLLDFTKSLLIALFFACEESENDSAVWFLNIHNLVFNHSSSTRGDYLHIQFSEILDNASKIVGQSTKEKGLLPIEPEKLNERMSIQQGLSIMPIDANDTFMNNMMVEYNWNNISYKEISIQEFKDMGFSKYPEIAKIKIDINWKNKILRFLDRINISANSLFPGLDGFAKSLKIHLLN